MIPNEDIVNEAASFKKDADKRFKDALALLIALGFKHRDLGDSFTWSADEDMYAEALRICREMSDGLVSDCRERAYRLMEALDYADDQVSFERDLEANRESFDNAGSHLLDLLAMWLIIAFNKDLTKGYLRVAVIRYLKNPFASPFWGGMSKDVLKWGSGFRRDILSQIGVIGQNWIVSSARYAEWVDEMAKGAVYYVRRRGSGYDCEMCESIAGIPIPIDTPFELLHSNCMCYPEYFFEPMP